MGSWQNRSKDDLDVLTTIFWSAGASRHGLAARLDYSKSKANAMVAAFLDEGLLDEVGLQDSSGGRRAETLQLSASCGVHFIEKVVESARSERKWTAMDQAESA